MNLIGKLTDKLIFGITLILALQVPQLADHYQQFLAGLFESTSWQVEGYEANAREHKYPTVRAMIEHHQKNEVLSVRSDAEQKLRTLEQYEQIKNGMRIFADGHLFAKVTYMFNPARYDYLVNTISNFTPGIPLTMNGLAFGVIVGLVFNYMLTLPFVWIRRKMRNTAKKEEV